MTASHNSHNNKEHSNKDLSKAASIMGSKNTSHEEKSRAASELGKKGGEHSHGGGRHKNDDE